MGMDVLLVHMDADDRLVAGQMLCRELPGDLQRQLRGDLAGLEGLDDVIILDAVCFAHCTFRIQHLPACVAGIAIQIGCKNLFVSLIAIEHIVDADIQTTFPGKNFCNSHLLFRHLVHEFIDTIQHIQPVFGIVRFGNSSIDTAGDLIDIVADMMDLRAEGFDLLRRERANLRPQNEAPEVGGFGKAATSGAVLQQRFFLLGQP